MTRCRASSRLIHAAREQEAVTIYVNDHHGDWSATAAKLAERAAVTSDGVAGEGYLGPPTRRRPESRSRVS